MNETDRILQLVAEGIIRPDEATRLLEAIKQAAKPIAHVEPVIASARSTASPEPRKGERAMSRQR